MKNQFLSTQELGALLGVTRQTIRNWIKKGDIQAFHIGQNLKIRIEEAARLLIYYGLPCPDWLQQMIHDSQSSETAASQGSWSGQGLMDSSIPTPPASGGLESLTTWSQETRNGR